LIKSVASLIYAFFTTNFVGSLDIRASREVFPIEVRSPEIEGIAESHESRPFKDPARCLK
jgi:hypothetical protein